MVEQRYHWDCAVCAHAMYLGKTYDEIFEAYGKPTEGFPLNKSVEYLWSLGHDVEWFENEMPNTRAVVIVQSKHFPGKWHSIYFDGQEFYDPSPKEKYIKWQDVQKNLVGTVELGLEGLRKRIASLELIAESHNKLVSDIRAENERLIGIIDIEIDRKAILMNQVSKLLELLRRIRHEKVHVAEIDEALADYPQ